MRYLYSTDLHGSDRTFRKLLALFAEQRCDVLIIAGDVTGKDVFAIVEGGRHFRLVAWDGSVFANCLSANEVDRAVQLIADKGGYAVPLAGNDVTRFHTDQGFRRAILEQKALERLRAWLSAGTSMCAGGSARVLVLPGNDDPEWVDDAIESIQAPGVALLTGEPLTVGRIDFVSLDRVNPSGIWQTCRESSEDDLARLIESRVRRATSRNLVFVFHAPPYGTKLDLAPRVKDSLLYDVDTVEGLKMVHCGSVAVRDAVVRYRPKLGLHGHIHESAGAEILGETLCVNPGSDYSHGMLRAFMFDVTDALYPFGLYDENAPDHWASLR